MSKSLIVVAAVRGEERYIICLTPDYVEQAMQVISRWSLDDRLSLTPEEGAALARQILESVRPSSKNRVSDRFDH